MPLTKEKVTLSQSAMEDVNFSNAVCLITGESLDLLLNNNQSLHQKLVDLNEKMLDLNQNVQQTLHRLTDIMENMVQHSSNSATSLDSKLDKLIEAVSVNNTKVSTLNFDENEIIKKHKQIVEQKVRSNKVSDY